MRNKMSWIKDDKIKKDRVCQYKEKLWEETNRVNHNNGLTNPLRSRNETGGGAQSLFRIAQTSRCVPRGHK